MNAWERIRKNLINKKNRAVFAIQTIFLSKKSLYRWALAINVGGLMLGLFIKSDQSKELLTKQTQFFSEIEIPVFMRSYIYSTYAKYYQVNTDEVELPFSAYPTFSSFFTRKIIRQYPEQIPNSIASPCDGKILSFSEVNSDSCHLIKGLTYSLSELVFGNLINLKGQQIQDFLKKKADNKLFQIVIYLAPGDYHRFHSPTNIQILKQLKIPGKCDAVREESLLNGSRYEKNGRVSIFSQWSQGLLSMVMVGALNVTRIHINDVSTLKKGEQLGYFNLGSTIVLVVETKGIKDWKIKQGEKVKYGEPLFEYVQ